MSKILDYSKFDHIDSGSDDDGVDDGGSNTMMTVVPPTGIEATAASGAPLVPTIASDQPPMLMTKKGANGRLRFEFEGRTIYEWEQSLEEVNLYLQPPSGVTRHIMHIVIYANHLLVGLKGAPPFIDEDTGGVIVPDESTWTFVDGEITITMQKMRKGEAWDCALVGRGGQKLDPVTKEEVKKKLLLERFQEEHAGFDFSSAEFNGSVPDAREFMGGIKYN